MGQEATAERKPGANNGCLEGGKGLPDLAKKDPLCPIQYRTGHYHEFLPAGSVSSLLARCHRPGSDGCGVFPRLHPEEVHHAVSHAKAFPDVARLWYESGPKRTFEGIADFLEKESAAGRLRIADPGRAALLFAGMIIFHDNMRLLVCLPPSKRSELKEAVSEAVEVFLAAYGS